MSSCSLSASEIGGTVSQMIWEYKCRAAAVPVLQLAPGHMAGRSTLCWAKSSAPAGRWPAQGTHHLCIPMGFMIDFKFRGFRPFIRMEVITKEGTKVVGKTGLYDRRWKPASYFTFLQGMVVDLLDGAIGNTGVQHFWLDIYDV